MPQLVLPCPHCKAEKVGFAPRGAVGTPDRQMTLLFLQCEGCGRGVIAEVNGSAQQVTVWQADQAISPGQLLRVYPTAFEPRCPAENANSRKSLICPFVFGFLFWFSAIWRQGKCEGQTGPWTHSGWKVKRLQYLEKRLVQHSGYILVSLR
jgi:hypothetical protein